MAGSELPEDRKDTRFSLNARRAFMLRNIRARGAISMALLNQHIGNISASSLQGDIDFMRSLGFSISLVESGGRRYLVDSQARHIGAKSERMDLNVAQKHSIARVACSLLLGLPGKKDDPHRPGDRLRRLRLEESNPEIASLWDSRVIRKHLLAVHDGFVAADQAGKLWEKLKRMWIESNLTIFCDAGTTNDRLGFILRDVFLPTNFSPLRNLQVCTNSRHLFNMVADPEVCAKGISTGGYQLGIDGATDSMAGTYTESWLRATEGTLKFAMAFIGCTAVDAGQGFLLSDSFEEKTAKEIAMARNRSQIVVAVADRSKFELHPMREGFRFSAISPDQIDLIITNEPSASKPVDEVSTYLERIRSRLGVPVIEAPLEAELPEGRMTMIQRGREIRSRVPYDDIEKLLSLLGLERSLSSEGNEESAGAIQTKYVSHSVELFLNAAVKEFIESPDFRKRVQTRFDDSVRQSFLREEKKSPSGS